MKNIAVTENHLYNKAYSKGKRFSGRLVRIYVLKDLKAKRIMLANPEKRKKNHRTRMFGTSLTRRWMELLGVKTHYVTGEGTQTILL